MPSRLSKRLLAFCAASAASVLLAPAALAAGSGYTITARTGQTFKGASIDLFLDGVDDSVISMTTTASGARRLPFKLRVYGTSYSRVVVSSNGNLQFTNGSGSASYFNDCLPSGGFNYPVVAPFWDDIVIAPYGSTSPSEGLFDTTKGVAPHRQFIVNWRGHHFGDNTPIRAGVIFNEGSTFTFQYLDNDAANASIGVQRSSTGPATQWACNQGASVFPGLTLTFKPS